MRVVRGFLLAMVALLLAVTAGAQVLELEANHTMDYPKFDAQEEAIFNKLAATVAKKVKAKRPLTPEEQSCYESLPQNETGVDEARLPVLYWRIDDEARDTPRVFSKAVCASSELKPQGGNSYAVKKLLDNSYKTAWVEGKADYGVGEKFVMMVPRGPDMGGETSHWPGLRSISIAHGYVKSPSAYKNNSRIKTLRLYIAGKRYSLLHLKDLYKRQIFSFPEVIPWPKDAKVTFEIVDVYPGAKYKDTAITEMDFYYESYNLDEYVK